MSAYTWFALLVLSVAPLGFVRAQAASMLVCVRDAATGAVVNGVTIRSTAVAPSGGAPVVFNGPCGRLSIGAADTLLVARVGYQPRRVLLTTPTSATHDTVQISLSPRTISVAPRAGTDSLGLTVLDVQRVRADAPVNTLGAGRVAVAMDANEARARGAASVNGVIALLPYTSLRSARGESGLSLRGARREQVVVTLDGQPLNDPATGLADVSDLPLVALQQAQVIPGADPLGAGNGASGGVLALNTAAQRLLHVRSGAFGSASAEGAWSAVTGSVRVNGALSHRFARNDFGFVNDAGVEPVRESRVNNDERHSALLLGAVAPGWQATLLASAGERGMVGAANVRTYDADRSRTERLVLRGQGSVGPALVSAGVRAFALAYRDPSRPALDSRARAWATDMEWRSALQRGARTFGVLRAGVGGDGLRGTGDITQQRLRAFAAWGLPSSASSSSPLSWDIGVRADAVERSGVQPTASAGLTWRVRGAAQRSHLAVLARASQAVRVPTLYDLYFSSPQRLSVRPLAPERVTLDASTGLQGTWQHARVRTTGELTAVARDTRDAIVWFPGNFGWSPANVGRERLRGGEGRLAVASSSWQLSGWGTWYESTLRTGGLTIPTPYVPRLALGAQAQWQHGAHRLSANWRHQGPRPFTAGPRNPLFELPSASLLDLAIARTQSIGSVNVLATFALDNATDVRWQSVRGFPMPGRAWSVALTLSPRP